MFSLAADGRLDDLADNINVSIYRIVQESITNAVRHGQARQVTVSLQHGGSDLLLEIRDDGQGGPASGERREAGKSAGFGLLGMEERVLALGGSLSIRPAPQRGTVVGIRLPLTDPGQIPAGVQP